MTMHSILQEEINAFLASRSDYYSEHITSGLLSLLDGEGGNSSKLRRDRYSSKPTIDTSGLSEDDVKYMDQLDQQVRLYLAGDEKILVAISTLVFGLIVKDYGLSRELTALVLSDIEQQILSFEGYELLHRLAEVHSVLNVATGIYCEIINSAISPSTENPALTMTE